MEPIELSARIGAMIVHAAAAGGVPARELEQATGFEAARAADPDARIPLALETRLWEEAAARARDDAFGLHAAERLEPGMFGVLDYALRSAPTPRTALDRLARYNRLEHDAAVIRVVDQGATTRVEHSFRIGGQEPSRHAAEFTLAAMVVLSGQMTGTALRPHAVEFRHLRPASLGEHVRRFGVEPRFGATVNALDWEAAALARPNLTADPRLSEVVLRHAESLLAARPEPAPTIAERVRRLLTSSLGEGELPLAQVAARLKMSERSLQRRLAAEGVGFDVLLDEVRRELALRYLADPKIAIAEIAYLLGYSEPSPFHRAFRRWTGKTPSQARAY